MGVKRLVSADSDSGQLPAVVVSWLQDNLIPSSTEELLAAGNSITAGANASTVGNYWTAQLPAKLASTLGSSVEPFTVRNAGAGGDRTSDILGRLAGLYQAGVPSMVLVLPSINDRKINGDGVPPAVTMANIKKMIGLARLKGVTPLLATEAPTNPARLTAAGQFSWASEFDRRAVNTQVRALAAGWGLPLADVDAAFATNDTSYTPSDGLHPNDAGHAIYAQAIAEGIAGLPTTVYGKPFVMPTAGVTDEFDRPDSATAVGNGWTANRGTWGINTGRAYSVTGSTWDNLTRAAASTNHEVIVTGSGTSGAAYSVGAVVRRQSDGGHYLALLEVQADRSAVVKLFAVADQAPTQISIASFGALGNSADLEFAASGSNLTIRVNGITLIEATNTTYTAGTGVGIEVVGPPPVIERVQIRTP